MPLMNRKEEGALDYTEVLELIVTSFFNINPN